MYDILLLIMKKGLITFLQILETTRHVVEKMKKLFRSFDFGVERVEAKKLKIIMSFEI